MTSSAHPDAQLQGSSQLDLDPSLLMAAQAAVGMDTGMLLHSINIGRPADAMEDAGRNDAAPAMGMPAAAAEAAAPSPPGSGDTESLGNAVPHHPSDVPPLQRRRLAQTAAAAAAADDATRSACGLATPTPSPGPPFLKTDIEVEYGEVGIAMSQTNVIPPDPTLAVGPAHALHVVNSLVRIIPLTSSGTVDARRAAFERLIPLPDWFSLVASPCTGGYIYPAATYDKLIGRFLLTAICGYDSNQILLAVSESSSATGMWVLYSFPGEVTQATPMRCTGYPVSLQSQIGYNVDGVYLTWTQNCPDNQDTGTGAIIMALPKVGATELTD